jgi:hypothetical protein
MPLTSIMWNVGCIVGLMLGGSLSTPARQYPNTFIARVRLFQDFPYVRRGLVCPSYSTFFFAVRYLLPCFAGASIAFAALMFGYFGLEETKGLKNKKLPMVRAPPSRSCSTSRAEAFKTRREDRSSIRAGSSMSTASSSLSGTLIGDEEDQSPSKLAKPSIHTNPSTAPSALELLRHLPLQRVITSSFILNIVGTSYDVVFSLLCYTPIHLGGLSRTVRCFTCPIRYILTFSIAS